MKRRTLLSASAALGATVSLGVGAAPAGAAPSDQLPSRAEVLAAMARVNDYWIGTHANPGDNGWARATYFSGNMAHYRLTRDARYLNYAVAWAEQNGYNLIGGAATRFADNHCAGQVYLDLYQELGGASKIAVIEDSLTRMVNSTKRDDWWWVDALHMAMPPFARLGALRGNTNYWLAMYQLYHHTKRLQLDTAGRATGLYSEATPLWYRDNGYAIDGPQQFSSNGLPMYWSRGNGWAVAAHAKVLQWIPLSNKRGPEYANTLRSMAAALAPLQRSDGFWNSNLGDPAHFGGPETTGTAFHAYGIAYGIRTGLLDRAAYLPIVARAWNGMLATAVRADGFLGYCQPVGAAPAPTDASQTADYGVGAFLLAGTEIAALTA
ncbi:glycoside hydrolase family 88 protein [Micromonospora sp. CB01531]|uniref:glycoside hydrolase family 88 protein n=1 Tax=Micromonospora sp. CB01531 TaxID=1718947 RepID=UPI00093A1D59|nr:glycoside hydrolase family 88 protein [Micromonospora sp. CB01531]OKI40585.1 glycosyl hydrolase family 88 [Micromonospora sp. CB01531]